MKIELKGRGKAKCKDPEGGWVTWTGGYKWSVGKARGVTEKKEEALKEMEARALAAVKAASCIGEVRAILDELTRADDCCFEDENELVQRFLHKARWD